MYGYIYIYVCILSYLYIHVHTCTYVDIFYIYVHIYIYLHISILVFKSHFVLDAHGKDRSKNVDFEVSDFFPDRLTSCRRVQHHPSNLSIFPILLYIGDLQSGKVTPPAIKGAALSSGRLSYPT